MGILNLFGNKKIKLTIHNGHRNNPLGLTGTSGETTDGHKFNEVDYIDSEYYAIKKIIDEDKFLSSVITLAYDDAYCRNAGDSDYYVCLHCNGSTNKEASGGFVDDHPDDAQAEESWKFAKSVADSFFPGIGIPYVNGSTKDTKFYFAFGYVNATAKQFIIEQGFMTNKSDMDKLADVDKAALYLVDGMVNYWKLNEPVYKEAYNRFYITDPKEKEIVELKRSLATQKTQFQTLLADKDKELLRKLQDYKDMVRREVGRELDEALNKLNTV